MSVATAKKNEPVTAEIREVRGSRKSQLLRMDGKIPAVLYGLGKDTISISLPAPLTASVLRSGTHTIDLVLAGKKERVLVKSVQYDYLNTTIEHMDLMRIDPNQRVRVKIPLEFRGIPKGAKGGGIMETQLAEVELEVKALEIPDLIRVNVEHLELHQVLHAREIQIPAGAELITHPEQIIVQVRTIKEEVAAVEVEGAAAEPEVIGKKKEEEGAEGADAAAKPGDKPAAKK